MTAEIVEMWRIGALFTMLVAAGTSIMRPVVADNNTDSCPTTIPNGYMLVETLQLHGESHMYCDYMCNQGYWKLYSFVICDLETGEFTVHEDVYCQFHKENNESPSESNSIYSSTEFVAVASSLASCLFVILLLILVRIIRKRIKARYRTEVQGGVQLTDMPCQPGSMATESAVSYIEPSPPLIPPSLKVLQIL